MKKIMLTLLLSTLLLVGCNKKKNQLPDEYSFLIGKWECTNCDNHTVVSIEKDRLAIASYKNRLFYGKFININISKILSKKIIIGLIKQNNSKEYIANLRFNLSDLQKIELITHNAYYKKGYVVNYQLRRLSE